MVTVLSRILLYYGDSSELIHMNTWTLPLLFAPAITSLLGWIPTREQTLPKSSPISFFTFSRLPVLVCHTSIWRGLSMDPVTSIPSKEGCHAALKGVNHLPVLLLCLIWHWGVNVALISDVLKSLILSSVHIVTTWFPDIGEKKLQDKDLVWPNSSLTGDINLVDAL